MFYKVEHSGINCRIVGYGHANRKDPRFIEVNQETFIGSIMSNEGRRQLLGSGPPWSKEAIAAIARDWEGKTGIYKRIFFSGSTTDLAIMAVQECLKHASVRPEELDLIIAGSNTGPGYASLGDRVKNALGPSDAACWDLEEACTTGSIVVFNGWDFIHSGVCPRYVLVVCAEKATRLADHDKWKGSNLFGDDAFAVLLAPTKGLEAFIFFSFNSLPFGGQIDLIRKTDTGFEQEGDKVQRFVCREGINTLVEDVARAGIDPKDIDHLVPHQPSGRTLDLFEAKLRRRWPEFTGVFHRNVEFTGNTSSASTGSIISAGVHDGTIKPGELVVVTTFGAGLSIGDYAFRV